ncbi:bifunctional [glutamate--ammonia ligase]-adenylyl-L-tyrosine phosphorylase/[glutamate--ammonia-ligase] adenylyltransferase [Pseudaeromonas sharmana]|uniref:Bifunctional glutamine synthetase adenylyltransferase/adenylyl-removing enzyme n=1 Tax=Pseudaeromonas sharmana TaxID=328412 RepID=A0ABV8CRI4_9GAMM
MHELPPLLLALAERQWQRFLAVLDASQQAQIQPHVAEVQRVFALSDFIAESAIQFPDLLLQLLASGELQQACRHPSYGSELAALLHTVSDEEGLKRQLRLFRRRAMLVIAWRELLGYAEVEESFIHLTRLADTLISQARDWLYARACKEWGTPYDEEDTPQELVILGMGKLGGGELNFSSDIDLIFCYPDNGQTRGGRRALENQTFFIRLGQQLINVLHQMTKEGQVFRVDMRLRPFGDAGPLAISFAAMEDYYQHHGRSWERYAMVKARVIGPMTPAGESLQQLLRPFIYRRYIDFGAIDALRKMKAMIEAEVRRKGLKDNIKLGAGGIREVEFIAQAYQLIRGGRERSLQIRHLPEVLTELGRSGALPASTTRSLLADYRFLRRVENLLQEFADQQTQTLPDSERDRCRLVTALGFTDWETFYQQLGAVMARVRTEFVAVVGDDEREQDDVPQLWEDLWLTPLSEPEVAPLLAPVCAGEPETMSSLWVRFRSECQRRAIGPQGREALNRLMPRLLMLICQQPAPAVLLERIQGLLLQIITRSAYLQLMVENQGVLNQLLRLCAASDVVARQLARYPILLDELLDPQHLYHPTPLEQYRDELRQYLMRVPEEDVEQQMEALRQFKQIQLLRISAADIAGALPLMKVSDHLTWLAEAILDEVVSQAWTQVTERYGVPPHTVLSGERGFCVVAYGKLGGIELGYGSDLDLVFLHGGDPSGVTDGDKPIDVRQFYVRLAQRILHLFSTRTPSGILYEVDMRLRPSGDAGLLVSSLHAYEHYLHHEAWTWEHQALVRARAVVGEPSLVAEFTRIRAEVLASRREASTLRQQVVEMRDKMRSHLLRGGEGEYDLKQGVGGMTDIEFIAQYLVLAHAHAEPQNMTRWSDNVRIFEACVDCALLTAEQARQLKAAYLAIRDLAHRCTLSGRSRIVADCELQTERGWVAALWQQLLGSGG